MIDFERIKSEAFYSTKDVAQFMWLTTKTVRNRKIFDKIADKDKKNLNPWWKTKQIVVKGSALLEFFENLD